VPFSREADDVGEGIDAVRAAELALAAAALTLGGLAALRWAARRRGA
jgi:hypothetical protein